MEDNVTGQDKLKDTIGVFCYLEFKTIKNTDIKEEENIQVKTELI